MQELIGELIRWVGYLVLRIVTLGRYTGGAAGDELREGAFGLAMIAFVLYAVIRWSA
jgi:hypothetical protein